VDCLKAKISAPLVKLQRKFQPRSDAP